MQMPDADPTILARKGRLVARLRDALPATSVIDAEEEVRAYECDALTAYTCPPLAVTLPASTEEVATVLRICHELVRMNEALSATESRSLSSSARYRRTSPRAGRCILAHEALNIHLLNR